MCLTLVRLLNFMFLGERCYCLDPTRIDIIQFELPETHLRITAGHNLVFLTLKGGSFKIRLYNYGGIFGWNNLHKMGSKQVFGGGIIPI